MHKFLEVEIAGERAKIAFVPSLKITAQSKDVEFMLKTIELDGYNPFSGKIERLRLSKSLEQAYVCLEILKSNLPEMNIRVISGAPELENKSSKENPIHY